MIAAQLAGEIDLETWTEHPVVGEAMTRIDTDSVLDLLLATHDVMTDLEARFPGLTYDQIFNGHKDPDPQRLMGTAKACGASDADLALIFGSPTDPQDQIGPEQFELVRRGLKPAEIQKLGYEKDPSMRISALRKDFTPPERRVLDYIDSNPNVSNAETARNVGVNRSTVRQALRKRRYRQWLGQRQ